MKQAYSYIRFSTPKQLKGDSLRRQMEATEKYCREKGFTLNPLSLKDLGISGFHGKQKTKGDLGKFLELVKHGEIQKGSILIIESLDRLSREQVLPALNLFTSILEQGIQIVTLSDKMVYTEKSINQDFTQLIISLVIMSRAHEESLQKSKRVKASWDQKRQNIYKKKMGGRGPAWLEYDKEVGDWAMLEPNASIVKQIFDWRLSGYGVHTICKWLNKDYREKWIPGNRLFNGFNSLFISRAVLKNRSAIGEFEPHIYIDGKRTSSGEIVKDYYPPIISKEKFNRIQSMMKAVQKVGRLGRGSNLFTNVGKCGWCGENLQYENKPSRGKYKAYLYCSKAIKNVGCKKIAIDYDVIEKSILKNIKDLDVSDLLQKDTEAKRVIRKLKSSIKGKEETIADNEKSIENYALSLGRDIPSKTREKVEHMVDELSKENVELHKEVETLKAELANYRNGEVDLERQLKDIKELEKCLDDSDLRLRLKNRLAEAIKRIDIYPLGAGIGKDNIPKPVRRKHRDNLLVVVGFRSGKAAMLKPFANRQLIWERDITDEGELQAIKYVKRVPII